ncbi:hypothetical protein ACLOJK_009160 [Asimina triloba]
MMIIVQNMHCWYTRYGTPSEHQLRCSITINKGNCHGYRLTHFRRHSDRLIQSGQKNGDDELSPSQPTSVISGSIQTVRAVAENWQHLCNRPGSKHGRPLLHDHQEIKAAMAVPNLNPASRATQNRQQDHRPGHTLSSPAASSSSLSTTVCKSQSVALLITNCKQSLSLTSGTSTTIDEIKSAAASLQD